MALLYNLDHSPSVLQYAQNDHKAKLWSIFLILIILEMIKPMDDQAYLTYAVCVFKPFILVDWNKKSVIVTKSFLCIDFAESVTMRSEKP